MVPVQVLVLGGQVLERVLVPVREVGQQVALTVLAQVELVVLVYTEKQGSIAEVLQGEVVRVRRVRAPMNVRAGCVARVAA